MTALTFAAIAAVYVIGAYVACFISGYFDYEPVGAAAALWPFYALAFLAIGIIMPFIWIAMCIYGAGCWLRSER